MKLVTYTLSIVGVLLMTIALFSSMGCDEGMQMAGDVMGPIDEPDDKPTDLTMNGEVKQPNPDDPKDTMEPVDPPVDPEPETEPVVPEEIETITEWNPEDFTGLVYMPGYAIKESRVALPVPAATLTVMSGPRAGEITFTDENGRYLFKNIDSDELHLRVEREDYEPKEVIVSGSAETTLADGTVTNPSLLVQRKPGGILIGHRWPDEIRFIFEETLLMPDLLCVRGTHQEGALGYYVAGGRNSVSGLCLINTDLISTFDNSRSILLETFAHEIAHAHQHAVVYANAGVRPYKPLEVEFTFPRWIETPEGRAYVEARNKDLQEVGAIDFDSIPGIGGDNLHENAAVICSDYWTLEKRNKFWYEDFKRSAPNRYRWAKKWLNKKY